ncbi:RepA [Brachypodium phoenicoides associated virus 1]|nr:RepA [Brachypodium phoenicoides associated virus 1]
MASGSSIPTATGAHVHTHDTTGATNFLLRAINVFLTYPRCPLEPRFVGERLWNLLEPRAPIYCLAVRESHQDGTYHIHVLIQVAGQLRVANPRYFGLVTEDNTCYHPNIQSVRSANNVREYLVKHPHSQYEVGIFRPSGRFSTSSDGTKLTKDERMRCIIQQSTTRDEYLIRVKEEFPFDWATKLQFFQYSASYLFPETSTYQSVFPADSLQCNEVITDWIRTDLYQVSLTAYMLYHPNITEEEARENLKWMETYSQTMDIGDDPSTPAGPVGQEGPHGHGL